MKTQTFETTIGDQSLKVDIAPLASQANGSVIIRMGDTVVMVNAVMSEEPHAGTSYFPLTVDFEEKFYASGRIPGGRFRRREGRPSDDAILVSRFIDRAIRPLFDQRMRHQINVAALPLSMDEKTDPDMLAMFGASLVLSVSDIPWNGPVSTVRVAVKGDEHFINPSYEIRESADLELVLSGTGDKFNMIEGKSNGISEERVLTAIENSKKYIEELQKFQEEIRNAIGKNKIIPTIYAENPELKKLFKDSYYSKVEEIFSAPRNKKTFYAMSDTVRRAWKAEALKIDSEASHDYLEDIFHDAVDEVAHTYALDKGMRSDGRGFDEVRDLYCEIGLLPRTHGSGLFFRGDTHILSAVTLGSPSQELLVDNLWKEGKRRFMHQYNFPHWSVGETGRNSGPGRREIGHGALAEKALEAIMPSIDDFPYTVRIVSETLSSNGSSSMGSVTAACAALMDAGVPIREPVAGIAMGLMMKDAQTYKILTDLQGVEDHHGDMDFKVAGTKDSVTAIQMDVKVAGIPLNILKDAFSDAKKARIAVLNSVTAVIDKPRTDLSPHAPRIITLKINPDKIRDVIGPGGKMINSIIEETGVEIDIEQDGRVFIASPNVESLEKAVTRVEQLTKEYGVGDQFDAATVSRIFPFGAMVEFIPGQEGLVHISELAPFRVENVEDVVAIGDIVPVKIVGIDDMGRFNLSIKELTKLELKPDAGKKPRNDTMKHGRRNNRQHARR